MAAMPMVGVYKRPLPSPPAIDFASHQGKIFICACDLPTVMLGPWRWFDESMLDCCEPLENVKLKGISFGKLVCLGHCVGAKVEAFHANQTTIEEFRKQLIRCSTSDDCYIISSYHRGTFKQIGSRFMLVSRPHREPGMLYTVSCNHYNWIGVARYLLDDFPLLLRSDDVKDIEKVLSVFFTSLPSNFGDFVKWTVQVRNQEDGGRNMSPEEKARLFVKEEVLKQLQETSLFSHVATFLASANSCCRKLPGLLNEEKGIAARACCRGAEILSGKHVLTNVYRCQETCVKTLKTNNDMDMGDDIPAALLLALPSETWSGIKDDDLLQEMCSLASTTSLPTLLQEEVLHLRRQLHVLRKCRENKIEDVGLSFS
ncbi:hypothetical protein ACFE04_031988 [Oxalis oulophora]